MCDVQLSVQSVSQTGCGETINWTQGASPGAPPSGIPLALRKPLQGETVSNTMPRCNQKYQIIHHSTYCLYVTYQSVRGSLVDRFSLR